MKTIVITNQPDIAADCQEAGVSRIMVDLESIGKQERQASRTTFISTHRKEDIAKVRAVLKDAQLIVRINPWYDGSQAEIDHAIAHGADIIMLPMITDMQQLQDCAQAVAGRAQLLPLVETAYSMQHITQIAAMPDIPEIYIGLNDLHLSLGMEFLFEPLAEGQLEEMAHIIKKTGKPFGFGGIAKMGSGELPAEAILAEHERLGSEWVILSSRFCKDVSIEQVDGRPQRIKDALAQMHAAHQTHTQRSDAQRSEDAARTAGIIRRIASELKTRRRA